MGFVEVLFFMILTIFIALLSFHLSRVRSVLPTFGCVSSCFGAKLGLVLAQILDAVVLQVLSFIQDLLI